MLCYRVACFIVKAANRAVQVRSTLGKQLLKGICNAKLPVNR